MLAFAPGFSGDGLAAYAWAFGQGVLVDFTPCVYPLIPITVAVFGAKGVSRPRALGLASAYVLGMATLYTTLGVAIASTGGAFGAWLANPWVVLPIVALMLALAASMFGAFELQLPVSVQNRLNTVGGAGPTGAFLMGLVSGLISAPCTGPVLMALLAYIAQASAEGASVAYGASLLFTYALGMGTLFFAVALGASLFRPGPWMEHIKSAFGIAMITMAFWFARPLSPTLADFILDARFGIWAGVALALVGVLTGAIHLSFHGSAGERVRKTLGVTLASLGTCLVLNNALYIELPWRHVHDLDQFEAALGARDPHKPLVVDFAASWCLPCKEMELHGFGDPRNKAVLEQSFELIKVDVSDGSDDQVRLQEAFDSLTLPSVLIYPGAAGLEDHVAQIRAGNPAPPPATQFRTLVEPEILGAALDAQLRPDAASQAGTVD